MMLRLPHNEAICKIRYDPVMTDPSRESLVEQFLRVTRTMRRRLAGLLQPFELSPHQARALRVVCRQEGSRLSDVAESLRIAPRSATEVIDLLECRGYVERTPHPQDRRATLVVATQAGREVRAKIDEARHEDADGFFAVLSDHERASLRRILGKLQGD